MRIVIVSVFIVCFLTSCKLPAKLSNDDVKSIVENGECEGLGEIYLVKIRSGKTVKILIPKGSLERISTFSYAEKSLSIPYESGITITLVEHGVTDPVAVCSFGKGEEFYIVK